MNITKLNHLMGDRYTWALLHKQINIEPKAEPFYLLLCFISVTAFCFFTMPQCKYQPCLFNFHGQQKRREKNESDYDNVYKYNNV